MTTGNRMYTPSMSEVLNAINEAPKKEMIAALQNVIYKNHFMQLFDYTFNPGLKFDLPEGEPPYQPFEGPDAGGMLYNKLKSFYIFYEGLAPNLTKLAKQSKFTQLLESVDREDARLLLYIKDNRKLPQTKITKKIVEEAFPELKAHWQNHEQASTQ